MLVYQNVFLSFYFNRVGLRHLSGLPGYHRYWGKSLEPQNEEEKAEEKRGFSRNGFNQFISDRLPLDREVPDTRDPR